MSDSAEKPANAGSGPNLAIKGGGPAPSGGRGPQIRSPLVAGSLGGPAAVRNAAAASQPAARNAAAAAKPRQAADDPDPFAKSEVSAIRGLDDDSSFRTHATALSHHMFDTGRDRRSRSLRALRWILLIVVPLVIVLPMTVMPEVRGQVVRSLADIGGTLRSAKDAVIGLVRSPRKPRKSKRSRQPTDRVSGKPTSSVVSPRGKRDAGVAANDAADDTAQAIIGTKGNCETLTSGDGGGALDIGGRIVVAECFLAYDDARAAEETLAPLKSRIVSAREVDLNRAKAASPLAEAQQLLVVTYLKMAKTREADELLRGRCGRWSQTNTCVAKALVHADRHYDAAPLAGLFERQGGQLERKAQARLWYAGAQLAQQSDRATLVDQRFKLALSAAPKDALALRKQIYEMQAIDLYRRGEVIKLKGVISAAQDDLKRIDAKSKIKLSMLADLIASADKRRVIKTLLTREDVTYRARSDLDLIDILGPESLRYGFESEYQRLLTRTRAQFGERFRAPTGALKRLSLWEIRSAVSQGSFEQALQLLSRHERSFGSEPAVHHLRGVVELAGAQGQKSAMTAAADFQQAIRAKGSWESLYGLGIALTQAGKTDKVPAVIHDLEAVMTTSGQRFWTDMLKVEWYLAVHKYLNATKLLQDWAAKEPAYVLPRELLVDAMTKMGNKTGAEEQRRSLDELRRRYPRGQSPEMFGSPLGALAYERRPID